MLVNSSTVEIEASRPPLVRMDAGPGRMRHGPRPMAVLASDGVGPRDGYSDSPSVFLPFDAEKSARWTAR